MPRWTLALYRLRYSVILSATTRGMRLMAALWREASCRASNSRSNIAKSSRTATRSSGRTMAIPFSPSCSLVRGADFDRLGVLAILIQIGLEAGLAEDRRVALLLEPDGQIMTARFDDPPAG